jgi:mono/diheme cytochrome c family protein
MRLAQPGLLVVVGLFLVSAGSALLQAQAKTVWDGAYTDEQATRAAGVFGSSCANCHTLESSGGRRPLSGDSFWDGYTLRTVGDLLAYVSKNMPNGVNAGTLPAATYNDLVALILKSNGFPAGTTELTPESAATVQIVRKDGSSELPAGTLARVVGCLSKSGTDWVLTSATAPERVEKAGVGAEDATRPLGTGSTPLKFVLTRLDKFAGQRVSASGLLIGGGGKDGLNVTTVNQVAATCP